MGLFLHLIILSPEAVDGDGQFWSERVANVVWHTAIILSEGIADEERDERGVERNVRTHEGEVNLEEDVFVDKSFEVHNVINVFELNNEVFGLNAAKVWYILLAKNKILKIIGNYCKYVSFVIKLHRNCKLDFAIL